MNNNKVLFILIAIIFLAVGIGAGILISGNLNKQSDLNIGQDTNSHPENQLKAINMPEILYNLTGSIQEIEKDSIAIEVRIPYVDETNQIAHKIETRKAIITINTKFSSMSFIDTEDANRKTIQESGIDFSNLKIGDQVEVISNQDIKDKQEFEAVKVRILP